MIKRKVLIRVAIIIVLLVSLIIGVVGVKIYNARKVNTSIDKATKYLEDGKYESAILEFSKVISIDNKNEEAIELLNLTEDYVELDYLYKTQDYLSAFDLISEINNNKYLSYIEEKVNEISLDIEAKLNIMNEINNLDVKIEQLINENKFEEADDLINKYLEEELKQEYLDKLMKLSSKVNNDRVAYEEDQAELEKRLAEEQIRRQEEEKKKQKDDEINYSKRRIKEVLGIDVVYNGYGPYDYIADDIILELDRLGFANSYRFGYSIHDIVLYDISTDRIAYLSQRGSILIKNNNFTDIDRINQVFDIYEKHTDEELKSWFGL